MTRTTVFDTAWEMDLLMACLEWPDDQPTLEALQIVKPEWFLVGLNRALWEIFIAVAEETGGVDAAAIFTKIRKDPRFSEADRMMLTDTLFNSFHRSSAGSAQTPMLALREAHTRRTLGKLAGKIGALAADFVAPMSELEALALQAGDVVMNAADRADMEEGTLADCIDRYLIGEPLLDPHRSRNLAVFGIDTLDRELVAGPGSLGVLAAKTSAGKTSLAAQVLLRSQAAGIQTAAFSMEMDKEELGARLIALASGRNSGQVLRHGVKVGHSLNEDLEVARKIIAITKIPGRTFSAVCAKIRQLVRRWGVRLVVIDYFTLLNPPETGRRNRNDAALLGEMSKGFKQIAADLGICILLVSQLNRTVADGERPTLECLRETGQLEQDANWVLMLWTEKATYEGDEDRTVFAELQKNRGGKRWIKARTRFSPATSRFEEDIWQTDEQPRQPVQPGLGDGDPWAEAGLV